MNQWSVRRKRIVLSIVLLGLVVLIGGPLFFLFYNKPTCFDKSQNGDETGVDCGGSCQLLCTTQSLPLILKGDPQVIEIRDNTYEMVAVVENPNVGAEIYRAGYILKLYDAQGAVPLKVVEGATYVPKGATFVVFEGPFSLGEGVIPAKVTLEWKAESLIWQKNAKQVPELVTKDMVFSRSETSPRLEASIENLSLENVSNIDLVAVVSDEIGNVAAVSKTFIEDLSAKEKVPVVFTWLEPFKIKEDVCGYPVDVAMVIDRSGSMNFLGNNPPQPLTDVKNTALSFVNQLGKNDLHALVSFANEASAPIDATLGVDIETIRAAISGISILPGVVQNTNIGAGILAAREELNSSRHREGADRALVLLTDGVPTLPEKSGVKDYPKTYSIESAELARNDGISIYTIGLGKDVDKELLKRIATTTTEAYFAPTTKELSGIYGQIATKICKVNLVKTDIYVRIFPDRSFLR
ncbi:MAG: vWA domain-containing protein [Minisyncoccia bacterium]